MVFRNVPTSHKLLSHVCDTSKSWARGPSEVFAYKSSAFYSISFSVAEKHINTLEHTKNSQELRKWAKNNQNVSQKSSNVIFTVEYDSK